MVEYFCKLLLFFFCFGCVEVWMDSEEKSVGLRGWVEWMFEWWVEVFLLVDKIMIIFYIFL